MSAVSSVARTDPESAFALGEGIAAAVARLWLQSAGGRTAGSLDEAMEQAFQHPADRRRVSRTFERIADEVAEAIGPVLGATRATSPLTRRDAIGAVAKALRSAAPPPGVGPLEDVEPFLLARRFKAHLDINGTQEVRALCGELIDEATDYIVALASCLSAFPQPHAFARLRAEKDVIDLTQSVIAGLPKRPAGAGLELEDFETRYRREIVRKADRVVLFGLSVAESSRRYPLTAAYISLTAAPDTGGTEDCLEPADADEISDTQQSLEFRVEEIVANTSRLLLRGEAGSGKTTLLQYLAVQIGTGTFSKPLENINGMVPFLVHLRRYAGEPFPAPDDFVAHSHPELHRAMPRGWVTEQLRSGRALVLVDGVDEVVSEDREAARQWLEGLCTRFPAARYVVTSRPPAIAGDWLAAQEFVSAELQPMSIPDIEAFIEHWHDAARKDTSEQGDGLELDRLQAKLGEAVRASRPIRALATSPLLCAMLCALNRDRRSQLPDDRQELYRIALETLLDRRDVERELNAAEVVGLREKQVLLGALAYWLMRHGRTDMDRREAEQLVAAKIHEMPGIRGTGDSVFEFLLERSGLLREPVAGRIDFLHRTFQEYLAAAEAVERDEIPFLLSVAAQDEWREVVILAAGQARRSQREALIGGLLDAGDLDAGTRSLLHLLAVACLENSPELSAELTVRLHRALASLVPPTSMTHARAVASAGELAVPLLAEYGGRRAVGATAAATCVRALALIGGDAAMAALAGFGRDRRITVLRELFRAWGQFDIDSYAEQVLADCPFPRGIRLHSADAVTSVRHLRRLRNLEVAPRATATPIDLIPITSRRDLGRLRLQRVSVRALAPVAALRKLKTLELMECSGVSNIHPVAELRELQRLVLSRLPELEDIGALRALSQLSHLQIVGCPRVMDLAAAGRPSLRTLILQLPRGMSHLDDLAQARALRSLRLTGGALADLSAIAGMGELEIVSVGNGEALSGLDELLGLTQLVIVMIQNARGLTDVSAVSSWRGLTTLRLTEANSLCDLGPIARATDIAWLELQGAPLVDLAPLEALRAVHTVVLRDCLLLEDLTPIAQLPNLRHLVLMGCSAVRDLAPLARCRGLLHIDLERCEAVESVEPLVGLPNLRTADLAGIGNVRGRTELAKSGVMLYPRFYPQPIARRHGPNQSVMAASV